MMQHENAGCVLVEQAVHHFDLWQYLLDTTVEDIYAKMLDPSTVSERATVTAKLANGVIVSAMFTEGLKALNELEIYGDKGHLLLSMYDFDGLDVTPASEYPGTMGPRIRRLKQTLRAFPGALKRKKTGGDWAGSYRAEWQHFLDCIKTGKPSECGLAEGRRALTVGLAAMASLAEDRPVRIADAPREIRPYRG
jgi:predicted dehydrogenase